MMAAAGCAAAEAGISDIDVGEDLATDINVHSCVARVPRPHGVSPQQLRAFLAISNAGASPRRLAAILLFRTVS